jgi:hypothetical protein
MLLQFHRHVAIFRFSSDSPPTPTCRIRREIVIEKGEASSRELNVTGQREASMENAYESTHFKVKVTVLKTII